MEADAAKLIGAGLAAIGLGGVGVGIGNVFASMISSVARNPAAAPDVQLFMWIGFALVEAVAFYALLISLLILFVF
ncbi:MAG: ATP synthase F0 subunit C [Alphaproteobacteria bacterium]